MKELLFGTGGTPHSAKGSSTLAGIERIAELGLGCMEMEFVHGVKMGDAMAKQVGEKAKELGILLSAHAPYWINLNSREPEKIEASKQRLLRTVEVAAITGAKSVVAHAAFNMSDPPEQVYAAVKGNLAEVMAKVREEGYAVTVRPEVMGRATQFGTIDELIRLCSDIDGVAMGIDLAHWHARTAAFNTYDEFIALFDLIESKLGKQALDDMHFHFSGIEYAKRGEIRHLNLKDSDLNYKDLIRALKVKGVKGLVICESPNLEEDALLLQQTYRAA